MLRSVVRAHPHTNLFKHLGQLSNIRIGGFWGFRRKTFTNQHQTLAVDRSRAHAFHCFKQFRDLDRRIVRSGSRWVKLLERTVICVVSIKYSEVAERVIPGQRSTDSLVVQIPRYGAPPLTNLCGSIGHVCDEKPKADS